MYENKRLGFLFVLPFVLGVLLFKLFPFVMSFALSFTQYDLMDPPVFIGLQNYKELFGDDPLFVKSLGVTLWFALLAVPLRVGFALFIAHVLNTSCAASTSSAARSTCRRSWAAASPPRCCGASCSASTGWSTWCW
jgi:ABC-type sugar transport system permease subunit